MATGASALAALLCAVCAATGASAQAAANPTDVLAPAERETFTFTFRSTARPDLNVWTFNGSPPLELSAGEKWGFTLDLTNQNPSERFALDGLRAGAFFDVTPRMRLGGALSFSDESDAITRASRGGIDEDVPEVKFESAFRF